MSDTILISAGGTGGGIYPALTVVDALRRLAPERALHFVGSVGGIEERIVPREPFAGYHAIQGGPLHGVSLARKVSSVAKIGIGIAQSWRLAGQIRPAALFLTGGWVTFPVAVGCWLRGVPVAVYQPDIEPALVIRAISRIARVVMTPVPESAAHFRPGANVIAVGYPLRPALLRATRAEALTHFGLDAVRRTLLVFGGSLGAHTINEALAAILPDLLADGVQVLHISGERDWPAVQARHDTLPDTVRALYHAFAYLRDEMGLALAAADLVVSRAGASTLGEFPHFGLPAILVPYPFAWRYQKVNADWLASRGAALTLADERMAADLLPTIRALLGDPARLAAMRSASKSLAGQDVAERITGQVLALAGKKNA